MKNYLRKNSGITLIALVITIIVLLILAGVTIAMLTGENGLLSRATSTNEQKEKSQAIEEARLAILTAMTDKKGEKLTSEEIIDILEEYFNGVPNDITDQTQVITTKNNGYNVKISEVLSGVAIAGPSYTVIFNSNGGSNVSNQSVAEGSNATVPTNPTRQGYAFKGWYSDSGLQNAFDFQTSISSDTTLYAKWIEIKQFTYKNNLYDFEDGMTWGDYVSSSYNTYGFYIVTNSRTGNRIAVDPISGNNLHCSENGDTGSFENVPLYPVEWFEASWEVCCFDSGSKVLMADGSEKNIEEVTQDDYVMSLNEETGEFVSQKVKKAIVKHHSDDLVYINLSDGSRIGMRAYHPLLTTKGWRSLRPTLAETIFEGGNLEKLEIGDELVGIYNNLKIVSIEVRPEIENYDTYNLSMPEHHNYIVNGIVVHNAPSVCS